MPAGEIVENCGGAESADCRLVALFNNEPILFVVPNSMLIPPEYFALP
jgi:hypothetical protein